MRLLRTICRPIKLSQTLFIYLFSGLTSTVNKNLNFLCKNLIWTTNRKICGPRLSCGSSAGGSKGYKTGHTPSPYTPYSTRLLEKNHMAES